MSKLDAKFVCPFLETFNKMRLFVTVNIKQPPISYYISKLLQLLWKQGLPAAEAPSPQSFLPLQKSRHYLSFEPSSSGTLLIDNISTLFGIIGSPLSSKV